GRGRGGGRDSGRSPAGRERDVPARRASDARTVHRARAPRAGRRRRVRARPADGGVRQRGSRDPRVGGLRRARRGSAPRQGRGHAEVIGRAIAGLGLASLLASSAMAQPTSAARAELAPTRTPRARSHYGNFILAVKAPATGASRGVAIDLTRELAQRLGVPVELVSYTSVAAMVDAAKTGAWSIAFLGIDPAREGEISFSAAYLEIEATYLVPAGPPLRAVADGDRQGVRVAAPAPAEHGPGLSRRLQS